MHFKYIFRSRDEELWIDTKFWHVLDFLRLLGSVEAHLHFDGNEERGVKETTVLLPEVGGLRLSNGENEEQWGEAGIAKYQKISVTPFLSIWLAIWSMSVLPVKKTKQKKAVKMNTHHLFKPNLQDHPGVKAAKRN